MSVKRYDSGMEYSDGKYVLASDYFALEASILAGKREAYCEGWRDALKSCTDYHNADVTPQNHAVRRYPGKEAT